MTLRKCLFVIVPLLLTFVSTSNAQSVEKKLRSCLVEQGFILVGNKLSPGEERHLPTEFTCLEGEKIPLSFQLKTLNGKRLNFANPDSPYTVVHFNFISKKREILDSIKYLASNTNTQDATFLVGFVEPKMTVKRYIKDVELPFDIVPRAFLTLRKLFGYYVGLPTTIIVDKDNNIKKVFTIRDYNKLNEEILNFIGSEQGYP